MTPTICRMVVYVGVHARLAEGGVKAALEAHAAVVTFVHDEPDESGLLNRPLINLKVFGQSASDPDFAMDRVSYDDSEKPKPGTWRWPVQQFPAQAPTQKPREVPPPVPAPRVAEPIAEPIETPTVPDEP